MTPPAIPANDGERATTRDMLAMSLLLPEPEVLKAKLDRSPMSIAWDVAAERLAARDCAGFDAAMRIFRALERVGPIAKRLNEEARSDG